MRVVAGTHRGRPIRSPVGAAIRPTGDRVREAIFNALYSLGYPDGADVLDLYAGTGALGIEALSRGARSATFVDDDRDARSLIEANLTDLDLLDAASVVAADALRFCQQAERCWDLAFADPPYAADPWPELAAVVPADALVVESARAVDLGSGWDVVRERRYGASVVVFARSVASAPR